MHLRNIILAAVFGALVSANGLAQLGGSGDGQRETVEGALRRHHIVLTKKALVAALRSPDAEVRRLAAQKLAQDGAKDTIPSLVEALDAESLPLDQVNIAFSLAQLGDDMGPATLKGVCTNSAAPAGIRMIAAQYMQWLHADACMNAVVDVLQSGDDADSRIHALSLISSSDGKSQRIIDLVVKALADSSSGVRMNASNTLGRLQNVSAIPYLESALAHEENEACRIQMQIDLRRLQEKREHP